MKTIKITIEYDGTRYAGWQIQKNADTIQSNIQSALTTLFGEKITIYGSGRTDAGVHAKGQVAHFSLLSINIPIETIPKALNAHLPEDIRIVDAQEVSSDFHSQFNASGKRYCYTILNSNIASVFDRSYYWKVPYKLSFSAMKKEAQSLVGKHDFKAFQAKDKKERSSVRTIKNIILTKKKNYIIITIEADGFLYNMVRNIVGTLIEIGRGKLPQDSMQTILQSKKRKNAGPTAPAKGLVLEEVFY